MLNTLLLIAGTAPAVIIAIMAHNRAVAAEAAARQAAAAAAQPVTHVLEVRHTHPAPSRVPELPPFLQTPRHTNKIAQFRRTYDH